VKKYRHIFLASLVSCLFLFVACTNDPAVINVTGKSADKTPYEFFVELSAIPRCTNDEEAVSNYLIAFALSLGLDDVYQDDVFNVLIRKGGTRGRENEPPIILQAHVDMVCRAAEGVEHDFKTDPIIPVTGEDGWITAQKQTTLGADNGSGVAMIMAVLASKRVSHPPIEALITTQEETGLIGADLFDVSLLNGRRLINLDNIEEGELIVSSKYDESSNPTIPLFAKIAARPEWTYREDSPLRDRMVNVFKDFYGSNPLLVGINSRVAGVECLVFADKVPDMDMVSIGPDIVDIHRSTERMNLESFERVYEYLVRVLGAL